MKTYIGIDNGVTGAIGIITTQNALLYKIPTKKHLNYTKAKQFLTRVDGTELHSLLSYHTNAVIMLERPMVNPTRFKATISAIRALEATLIVLELLKLPYEYVDSKKWQKELLPSGLVKDELKIASLEIGKRLFPNINWKGFKDADGLLIAEYLRRKSR